MANRRSFLLGIGAALAAPAVVRAESLMRIAVLRKSMVEITATEVLNAFWVDQWHRQKWQAIHLGFSVTLSEITSDGVRHTEISPEEFYAR